MARKVIITVAPTSNFHGKDKLPHLPEQPDEIAQAVYECWNEGAAIVHIHARDKKGIPTNDVEVFREINTLVREKCDIVIQDSIAPAMKPGATAEDGLQVLDAGPEMASLDMGLSCVTIQGQEVPIHWTRGFLRKAAKMMLDRGIKPEMEVHHDGMMTEVNMLINEGLVTKPIYINFVLGMTVGQGKVPYTPKVVMHLIDMLPPDSIFGALGIAEHQVTATTLSLLLGGNARVGFEDNIFYAKGELAKSNAQLVARTARIARELGLEVASPEEAREMLGIPALTSVY